MTKDFLNNDEIRYCLWFKGASSTVFRKNPEVMRRINAVQEFRLASTATDTRTSADTPYLFFRTPQTDNDYLCIPETSSEPTCVAELMKMYQKLVKLEQR